MEQISNYRSALADSWSPYFLSDFGDLDNRKNCSWTEFQTPDLVLMGPVLYHSATTAPYNREQKLGFLN